KSLPEEKVHTVKLRNITCKAWAIETATGERLESAEISMEMAVKEGWYQKNGSKWQTMPEQMLRYRAASFFGRIYAPEVLMGIRTQEEEQDAIIDVTPEPVQQTSPVTTSDLKANVVKEAPVQQQVEQQPVQEEKKPRARKQPKFVETENVQNSTQSEVVDAELNVEDLKRLQQEAEDLIQQNKTSETAQVDVNKSAEIKKSYMKTLTSTVQASSINGLKSQIEKETKLTEVDRNYLLAYVKQRLDEEGVYQQGQAPVDKIKSSSTRAGLERMIADTQDVHQLETETAQSIKNHKARMTVEDYNDLLSLYAQRKEVLSQQDIFADAVSLVDSYIAHIDAAQSVDRLNDIMSDPAINSLPDDDTARINEAYDRRYAEISE
ncbi:recombinase RecT, partial [Acinetobacter radioresistens]|uniref:recombinase RecT n=1 Tax=Acinetobacter radioresistens TaxID=40216 RepID=UPI00125F2840